MAGPYSKIQFVAYQVMTLYPTDPNRAALKSDPVRPPAPPGNKDGGVESWLMDDALVRVQRLRDVVRFAQTKLRTSGQMGSSDTLKIFVAPEFYFRLGDDGYPHAGEGGKKVGSVTTDNPYSVQTIIDTLRATFQTEEFRDWLIIPGTIFSYEGSKQLAKRWILLGEWNGSWSPKRVSNWSTVDWAKTRIFDISFADPASSSSLAYPAERGNYSEFNGLVASNYFNTTVAIKGGAHLYPNDPGYVINWKGPMSGIDVPWLGSQNRATGVQPADLADLNPTLRDARKNNLDYPAFNQWPTWKERIFTIDEITFGLEICLDHGDGILKQMVTDWTKYENSWTTRSKAYVRNDVGVDLQNLGQDALRLLTLDSAKLLQSPSQLVPPATTWNDSSVKDQIKLLTLDATKIPDAKMSLAQKFARGLARLDDLKMSENQSDSRKPTIDVHLISSCGINVDARMLCARPGGYVMHCDGSWGTWKPSTTPSRRHTFGRVQSTGFQPAPDSSIVMNEKVSAELELQRPPAASVTAWYEQRVIAYPAQPL